MYRKLLAASAAVVALAFAAPAGAVTHVLNLTWDGAPVTTGSFPSGPITYNFGRWNFTGLAPFTVQDGDEVEFVLNFSGATFTVPNSQLSPLNPNPGTYVGVNFSFDGDGPAGAGYQLVDGSLDFAAPSGFAGVMPVDASCGNCFSLIYAEDASAPFGFDGVTGRGRFVAAAPFEVNRVDLSYQFSTLNAAVPEPAAWAMMIAGFGAVGAALRRRERPAVA